MSTFQWISEKCPNSPEQLRAIHGWLTVFWLIMMPVSIVTGWIYVIAFVSVISIYANFVGHFSSWQASRTEVRQKDNE